MSPTDNSPLLWSARDYVAVQPAGLPRAHRRIAVVFNKTTDQEAKVLFPAPLRPITETWLPGGTANAGDPWSDTSIPRRSLLAAGCSLPLLALPGCATGLAGFAFENALRRLLTVSAQRAFANLLRENGFFQDELARIPLPPQLSRAGAIASALLSSSLVQNQLLRLMNRAAANAAQVAAPIVYDSIRNMSFADARALARGSPTAATDFLERAMGDAIVEAMFPGVGSALRLLDNGLVERLAQAATGIDFAGLQQHVTRSAARGIYRAIGREEAAIRADPRSTGDPVLTGLFAALR